MNATAHNPLNPPIFDVPEPPQEFGQDGGRFYRCYDAIADEIDDDMTQGLKEQLDGMLIFAGLFAGVNSAFLALTIPLLSADPADDANALLAQNNAILMQLLMGRNDSVPANPVLPSTDFSPSHDIFTINTLFSLSLVFAIISSFLAILGRQWLVYYRKRGGGGPDARRWTQLKRYLGAERWGLESVLDDVLPSLLQIGLIIFCASLILYLRHLSPTISLIVGIPMYLGLAFFVGSALCIIWDRFCPFHSPLSHLILLIARGLPWARDTVRFIVALVTHNPHWKYHYRHKMQEFGSRVLHLPFAAWFHILRKGRAEETLKSLEAVALRRTICTSNDLVVLLTAAANIPAIRDAALLEQAMEDSSLTRRLYDLCEELDNRMLHFRGYNADSSDVVMSIKRLSCSAIGHIVIVTSTGDVRQLRDGARVSSPVEILIPIPLLLDSSPNLIKANLAYFVVYKLDFGLSGEEADLFGRHLTACSDALALCSDRSFLSVFSWLVSWTLKYDFTFEDPSSYESLQRAYRQDINETLASLNEALGVLLTPTSRDLLDRDTMLINMLRCMDRIVTHRDNDVFGRTEHLFELLESCETVLRVSRLPEAAREVGRNLRMHMGSFLPRNRILRSSVVNNLESYVTHLQALDRTEFAYYEDIEALRVFGSVCQDYFELGGSSWETFNTFVTDVWKISQQMQGRNRRVRDPEERWCHWQEEPVPIRTVYSPYSQ
ncbi:hypothetical protein FRC01_000312 [Tulasnella sp. 417]|nr:hypothetical protein FRC01_000312 [Tulasnella sp. 417]